MGYYSKHKLIIISGDDHVTDYEQEVKTESDYSCLFSDEVKWYNRDEDMLRISKKHPETVFCIFREGEETFDICNHFYHNGMSYTEKLEYTTPVFDYKKLK